MQDGLNQITRPRHYDPAGATPSRREPFDMAAHRREFGKVWGEVGKAIGEQIRREGR